LRYGWYLYNDKYASQGSEMKFLLIITLIATAVIFYFSLSSKHEKQQQHFYVRETYTTKNGKVMYEEPAEISVNFDTIWIDRSLINIVILSKKR
jgi:flagellar basal body-associated protein FliL